MPQDPTARWDHIADRLRRVYARVAPRNWWERRAERNRLLAGCADETMLALVSEAARAFDDAAEFDCEFNWYHFGPRLEAGVEVWYFTSAEMYGGKIRREGYCEDCAGHGTAREACQHFTEYLLDSTEFPEEREHVVRLRHFCRVPGCDATTTVPTRVGPWLSFTLCPQHQTRETLETLVAVEEFWSLSR